MFLKVWDAHGNKKAIVAKDIKTLIEAGCSKLQMAPEMVKAYLEDGTEIDDDDVLMCMEPGVIIYLLHQDDEKPWSNEQSMLTSVVDSSSCSSSANSEIVYESDSHNFKSSPWPKQFDIPSQEFSSDLKNAVECQSFLEWSEKCELLHHLCKKIRTYTDNPSAWERKQVSIALITKYPKLKSHIGEGWHAWSNRIYDKMREIRRKKTHANMAVPRAKKRNSSESLEKTGETAVQRVKMRRRGEINWAPDPADGEDSISLNAHKEQLIKEFKKDAKDRDDQWVKEKMDLCFPDRRSLINENQSISTLKSEYPFLFTYDALLHEFYLLMAVNIQPTFFSELNDNSSHILTISKGNKNPDVIKTLKVLETQPILDVVKDKLVAALLLLPSLLSEKTEVLYKIYPPETPIEVIKQHGPTTPHVAVIGSAYNSSLIFVVGENDIVIDVMGFVEGVIAVIAVYYCFNIKFPPGGKCTYAFIEMQLLQLQHFTNACPRKLSTLCDKIAKAKTD